MVVEASTRETSGKTLVELGRDHPDLVVLGGDLNVSTFAKLFGAEFPDRFFDFGPAEQNIVSVAAGLAASGKIPVVSTFAVFGTSRPIRSASGRRFPAQAQREGDRDPQRHSNRRGRSVRSEH